MVRTLTRLLLHVLCRIAVQATVITQLVVSLEGELVHSAFFFFSLFALCPRQRQPQCHTHTLTCATNLRQMQHSTAQHSTAQHSTAGTYTTVRHSILFGASSSMPQCAAPYRPRRSLCLLVIMATVPRGSSPKAHCNICHLFVQHCKHLQQQH